MTDTKDILIGAEETGTLYDYEPPKTQLVIESRVMPECAGYTYGTKIARAWHDGLLSRMWSLGPRVVSGQLKKAYGGGMWKALDRMSTLSIPLLAELEALGITHPSTYSDCYHQLAPSPGRLKHTYNGMFNWWSGGPWEEATQPGLHRGEWYRYDLRSAYRWASTLGLPDPSDMYACIHRRPHDVNGLWVAYVEPRADLPRVFRNAVKPVVISSDELRTYGIMADVIRGVVWESTYMPNYVGQTLDLLPCAKESARAYWGRWVARDKLRCTTSSRVWELPNRLANFVWGWLIVGRVRMRVWQWARQAAHVYVDEVLVPHELPTGEQPGDWHLKEYYPNGVVVKRTGWYAALGGPTVMHTGVAA